MAKATTTPAAGITSVFDRMTHRSTPAPVTTPSTRAARPATAKTTTARPKRVPKPTNTNTPASSKPTTDTTPRTGRPRRYAERMTPTPVVLGQPHISFLDDLRTAIGARTHRAVSRSEIIRAVLDAVAASAVDLTTADNEEQIRTIILARLTP